MKFKLAAAGIRGAPVAFNQKAAVKVTTQAA